MCLDKVGMTTHLDERADGRHAGISDKEQDVEGPSSDGNVRIED